MSDETRTIIPRAGGYQLLPELPPDEYEALKADIAARGVLVPIEVDEQGTILDGHTRFRAWCELGKNEPPPVIVRPGLSEEEKRLHARRANLPAAASDQSAKAGAYRGPATRDAQLV